MKLTEMQYAALTISLATLGQTDLAGNNPEDLRTLEWLLEEAHENVKRALTHDSEAERRRQQIEQQNEERSGWLNMSDGEEVP